MFKVLQLGSRARAKQAGERRGDSTHFWRGKLPRPWSGQDLQSVPLPCQLRGELIKILIIRSHNPQVSVWSKWSSCSKSCGGGESERARSVERKSGHGGIACPNLRMTRSCNDFDCPIDCQVNNSELAQNMLKSQKAHTKSR